MFDCKEDTSVEEEGKVIEEKRKVITTRFQLFMTFQRKKEHF